MPTPSLRAQRSNPGAARVALDCFVAVLLAMTVAGDASHWRAYKKNGRDRSRPFRTNLDRCLRLAADRLAERGLRGGEACDRHAVRRAGDVIETDLVTERHRGRIAAMFAADADLQVGTGLAATRDADLDQFADAVAIDRDERID